MFGDGSLTFQEFAMGEPHPLAVIHEGDRRSRDLPEDDDEEFDSRSQ